MAGSAADPSLSDFTDYSNFYIGTSRTIPTSSRLLATPPSTSAGAAVAEVPDEVTLRDNDPESLEELYESNVILAPCGESASSSAKSSPSRPSIADVQLAASQEPAAEAALPASTVVEEEPEKFQELAAGASFIAEAGLVPATNSSISPIDLDVAGQAKMVTDGDQPSNSDFLGRIMPQLVQGTAPPAEQAEGHRQLSEPCAHRAHVNSSGATQLDVAAGAGAAPELDVTMVASFSGLGNFSTDAKPWMPQEEIHGSSARNDPSSASESAAPKLDMVEEAASGSRRSQGHEMATAARASQPDSQATLDGHQILEAPEQSTSEMPFDNLQSSVSYFEKLKPRTAVPEQPAVTGAQARQDRGDLPIFPESKELAAQRRISGHENEVAALSQAVENAVSGSAVRLAELRHISQEAASLQQKLGLQDVALATVGWPLMGLKLLRGVLERVDRWEHELSAAQMLITEGQSQQSLQEALALLETLTGSWLALKSPEKLPPGVDLGLDVRARSAAPLVSALVDHLASGINSSSDATLARRFITLLENPSVRAVLGGDLGALLPQGRTLRNLRAASHALSSALNPTDDRGTSPCFAPPGRPSQMVAAVANPKLKEAAAKPEASESFLQALATGSMPVLEAMVRQGALSTGCAQDGRGHTVLWHAITRQVPEVALLLLRHFPPQAPNGVDLSEVHARTGDSLLHLICAVANFNAASAELFGKVLAGATAETRSCANVAGQTFLHIAAVRLNFWVLTHVLSSRPELVHLFVLQDRHGYSPFALLARHMRKYQGAAPMPPAVLDSRAFRSPDWDRLRGLRPSASNGVVPPFADVELEVEDEKLRRNVRLQAHRAVLATASPKWHEQLRQVGQTGTALLKIDPKYCRSAAALGAAMHFVYSGEFCSSLGNDARLLWQLLCLTVSYRMPETLRQHATVALLRSLEEPANAVIMQVLLRACRQLGFSSADRQYVLYRFFCLQSLGDESCKQRDLEVRKTVDTVRLALSELESMLGG